MLDLLNSILDLPNEILAMIMELLHGSGRDAFTLTCRQLVWLLREHGHTFSDRLFGDNYTTAKIEIDAECFTFHKGSIYVICYDGSLKSYSNSGILKKTVILKPYLKNAAVMAIYPKSDELFVVEKASKFHNTHTMYVYSLDGPYIRSFSLDETIDLCPRKIVFGPEKRTMLFPNDQYGGISIISIDDGHVINKFGYDEVRDIESIVYDYNLHKIIVLHKRYGRYRITYYYPISYLHIKTHALDRACSLYNKGDHLEYEHVVYDMDTRYYDYMMCDDNGQLAIGGINGKMIIWNGKPHDMMAPELDVCKSNHIREVILKGSPVVNSRPNGFSRTVHSSADYFHKCEPMLIDGGKIIILDTDGISVRGVASNPPYEPPALTRPRI